MMGGVIGGLAGIGETRWRRARYWEEREREDNAVQRRAADLKAAGLSPTLAAGSPAQASQTPMANAPDFGGMDPAGAAMNMMTGQKNIDHTSSQIALNKKMQQYQQKNIEFMGAQIDRFRYDTDYYKKLGLPTNKTSGPTAEIGAALNAFAEVLDRVAQGKPSPFKSASLPILDKLFTGGAATSDPSSGAVTPGIRGSESSGKPKVFSIPRPRQREDENWFQYMERLRVWRNQRDLYRDRLENPGGYQYGAATQ